MDRVHRAGGDDGLVVDRHALSTRSRSSASLELAMTPPSEPPFQFGLVRLFAIVTGVAVLLSIALSLPAVLLVAGSYAAASIIAASAIAARGAWLVARDWRAKRSN
jgi:hypothetical protein